MLNRSFPRRNTTVDILQNCSPSCFAARSRGLEPIRLMVVTAVKQTLVTNCRLGSVTIRHDQNITSFSLKYSIRNASNKVKCIVSLFFSRCCVKWKPCFTYQVALWAERRAMVAMTVSMARNFRRALLEICLGYWTNSEREELARPHLQLQVCFSSLQKCSIQDIYRS